MKRFPSRPGWLASIAALVALTLTLSASYWQFGRAHSKAALRDAYLSRQAMPPLDLNETFPDPGSLAYRRVRATGTYVAGKGILLDNRLRAGAPGYEMVVPLQLSGTQRYVLVNRGWFRAGRDRSQLPAIEVPDGIVSVTGTAILPGRGALELSEETVNGRLWQNLNLERYRERLDLDVVNFVIREQSNSDDAINREWPEPGFGIATHQSYAVQWLLFSALIIFFYVYYGFIRNKPGPETGSKQEK